MPAMATHPLLTARKDVTVTARNGQVVCRPSSTIRGANIKAFVQPPMATANTAKERQVRDGSACRDEQDAHDDEVQVQPAESARLVDAQRGEQAFRGRAAFDRQRVREPEHCSERDLGNAGRYEGAHDFTG